MLYSNLLSVLPNNNIYSGVSEMVVTKCTIVKAGHSG